jgi:hypothetical protein
LHNNFQIEWNFCAKCLLFTYSHWSYHYTLYPLINLQYIFHGLDKTYFTRPRWTLTGPQPPHVINNTNVGKYLATYFSTRILSLRSYLCPRKSWRLTRTTLWPVSVENNHVSYWWRQGFTSKCGPSAMSSSPRCYSSSKYHEVYIYIQCIL